MNNSDIRSESVRGDKAGMREDAGNWVCKIIQFIFSSLTIFRVFTVRCRW